MLVAGTALLGTLALTGGQGASAARVTLDRDLPQTYLLKLDEPSTLRVFRQNRDDGLRTARTSARQQKAEVAGAQTEVIGQLPADSEVIYRTHAVLAGLGVSASPDDKDALEAIPGVTAVYPVAPKRRDNSSAVPLQSAPPAWQGVAGLRGEGQTIAVIDSGVDYTHADFGGTGTVEAYDTAHDEADQPVQADQIDNDKFTDGVGIDLVGDGYNPDPDADPETTYPDPKPDPNPLDCGGHGSHVAGSAAGYGVNADGSTYEGTYDGSMDFAGMKIGPGMAPESKIFAIKVFGCAGSTSVVTEAIDRAVDPDGDGDPSDRVDVINLSLGSDFGSVQDGDSVAANAAVSMGVSVVASAGNAGDVTDITGSPGDASRVLSVASSVDAVSKIDGAEVTIDGSEELYGVTRSGRYDWRNGPDLSGTVIAAPAENETACEPFEGTEFSGEIVIVKWNDAAPECGSIVRGDNLAAAGAGGFIFGSDSEDFAAGINGDDVIPGVLMVKSGADAIRDALEIFPEVTVEVDGTRVNAITRNVPEDEDKASSFTSRGIHATGNVKPDVTAVGSSVLSVAVGAGHEGTSFSGTSMASPMVAGLAALVRQTNPGWTPVQVKAGIMNTAAHDLFVNGSADPGSGTYGPPRVGAGRIDAELATGNEVLAYDAEGGAVSVSFGPVEATGEVTLNREVTVENKSEASVTYDVEYDPINEIPGAKFSASPSQVTVGPDGTATVTVSFEVEDPSQLTKAVDPTLGREGTSSFPRETLAEAFGRLLLKPTGAGTELRVPVYSSPRPASDMLQPASLEIHRTAATADEPVQVASFELEGEGTGTEEGDNGFGDGVDANEIESIAAGFELQASSGQSPECGEGIETSCWRLPEEKYADVKAVGYTANATRAFFAVAVHAPWTIPSDKAFIQLDLDVDRDGTPELFVYNSRLEGDDVFVSLLVDPSRPAGQRVLAASPVNGRFGDIDTALYDSDVIVLPVPLAALEEYGVDAENPRISYGIETYSYSSAQAIDMIGVDPESGDLDDPLSANLYEPGIVVADEDGNRPLVSDQPGKELTVTRNVASYADDAGRGLLMVHFHNEVGNKAQAMSLRGAATTTNLFNPPGTLTARVDAVGGDLPEITGSVTFEIDGREAGTAPVENGVAVLQQDVPHGATRQVHATYSGSADFDRSSDHLQRSDPRLTAKLRSKGKKNRFGWYRKPVTVVFQCATRGSDLTEDCPYPRRLARDGRGQQIRNSIVAFDGGRASVRVRGINIDRTRPVVRIRGVRRGAVYPRVRRARCVARDRTSGVLRCNLKRVRRGARVVYIAAAVDRAGNRKAMRVRTRLRP